MYKNVDQMGRRNSAADELNRRFQEFPTPSRGFRLAAYALDLLIASFTLFIGWAIWSLFTWKESTTPGHKILGQKIVNFNSGIEVSWWHMFVRECLVRMIFNLISFFTFGLMTVIDALFIFREDKRTLHDLIVKTIVVDDSSIALLKN